MFYFNTISPSNRIICIEDLSNELFYEILAHLEGFHIYKAFSKLNFRFQQLIMHPSLLLKIKFLSSSRSNRDAYWNNFFIPNRHHILSLYFKNQSLLQDLFKHCIIDSSFHRLETIVVNDIFPSRLMALLFYLRSLPRLFSLSIEIDDEDDCDFGSIYRMIFSLPTLKYNRLSFGDNSDQDLAIDVPLATNERFSSIEHLIIDHNCTLQELFSILRHTPQVRYLSCGSLIKSDSPIDTEKPGIVPSLTDLRIGRSELGLDACEIFLKSISFRLQVLSIKNFVDEHCLDADRWERLINNYIPRLRHFDYRELYTFANDADPTYMKMGQFTSSFWIERPWFFEFELIYDQLNCSIHTDKYMKKLSFLRKISCSLGRCGLTIINMSVLRHFLTIRLHIVSRPNSKTSKSLQHNLFQLFN